MSGVNLEKAKAWLDEIRKKESERGSFGNFYNIKEGVNRLRLLPPFDDTGHWCVKAASHFNVVEKRALLCPKETYNLPCPICEFWQLLVKGTKEDKAQASLVRAKVRYYSNILALDEKSQHDGEVYILNYPTTIVKEFLKYFASEEYGDITDIEKGNNIELTKTGTGLDTEYAVLPSRKSTPVSDWDSLKKSLTDLNKLVKDQLLPYEKLKGLLEGTETLEDNTRTAETPTPVSTTGQGKASAPSETPQKPREEFVAPVAPTTTVSKTDSKYEDNNAALKGTLERLRALSAKK